MYVRAYPLGYIMREGSEATDSQCAKTPDGEGEQTPIHPHCEEQNGTHTCIYVRIAADAGTHYQLKHVCG